MPRRANMQTLKIPASLVWLFKVLVASATWAGILYVVLPEDPVRPPPRNRYEDDGSFDTYLFTQNIRRSVQNIRRSVQNRYISTMESLTAEPPVTPRYYWTTFINALNSQMFPVQARIENADQARTRLQRTNTQPPIQSGDAFDNVNSAFNDWRMLQIYDAVFEHIDYSIHEVEVKLGELYLSVKTNDNPYRVQWYRDVDILTYFGTQGIPNLV